MYFKYNILFLIALIAPSTHAALIPRQDTSSSSSSTSVTSVPSTTSPITDAATLTQSSSTTAAPTTTSVTPVVSVISGGSLTTVVPSGTASSIAEPTGVSNSTNSNNTAPAACTDSNYALQGGAAPFCLPTNGSKWIQDTSYPVTWNPNFWPGYQGNVVIALLYYGNDGSSVITQNNSIANQRGFYDIQVDSSWLNGNQIVAAQLLIAPDEATSSEGGAHFGPVITLQTSDTPIDTSAPQFNSRSLAIVIAVPCSVVAFLVFICGVCYCTRKSRRLPEGIYIPRNGIRKSKRGYAEGRSRRTRAGAEKTNGEFELGTVSGYRDEPTEVYSDIPEESTRSTH